MKRILSLALVLGMLFAAVACGNTETNETTDTAETTTEAPAENTVPSVNEGEFKAGVYTATSSYASGEMNMVWNFILTLNADGTFVLTNDALEEKGTGTYALTDTCYTLTYSDERTGLFVVQQDGTLKMTTDFPYGMATIQLALVGDIVFSYEGGATEGGNEAEENEGGESTEIYTLNAGTYTGTYEKVSAMAGTVLYNYTAVVGEDGTFSYSVSFMMGENAMEGSSASGTYTVDGNKFTFTDSEGNVTEGVLSANDAITISLKASQMASTPYEVTLTVPAYKLDAGEYAATYEKVSAMAGTVLYNYTAVVGEDGTFSYSVSFMMGENAMEGSSASGTYTVDGNTFTFTDGEGNVTEGTLTADNTLVISLKASTMATAAYEVTFAVKA